MEIIITDTEFIAPDNHYLVDNAGGFYTRIFRGSRQVAEFRVATAEEKEQAEAQAKHTTEPSPAELRAEAYKQESDSLYMAWQKYLALNDPRAEHAREEWIAKVNEIAARFSG